MASFHPTAIHSYVNYITLQDREDAGRQLAQRLSQYKGRDDTIVLGLARGGVVTAYYVATELGLPLDVMVARKVVCPFHEELTIGALTPDGTTELNEHLMKRFSLKKSDLDNTIERERREAEKKIKLYRGDKPPLDLQGKVVIFVDDGIDTGASAKAALLSIRKRHPSKLVLAVPVMPFDRIGQFHGLVDDIVPLAAPRRFFAIGQFYRSYEQTEDDEVIAKLRDAEERLRPTINEKKGKKIDEAKTERQATGILQEERAAAAPQEVTSK
jgi:putative phosphoribosyl transferase